MNRDQYLAKRELLYGKQFATDLVRARGGLRADGGQLAVALPYRVRMPVPVAAMSPDVLENPVGNGER